MSIDINKLRIPVGSRVIIQREAKKAKTGGLIIPEDAQRAPATGRIMVVGPEVMCVKAGDRVLFQPYGCAELRVGDKDVTYLICEESHSILALLDDDLEVTR